MAERLPSQKTACTPGEMLHALSAAWGELFKEEASKDSLCVLAAHWAHETGWGKACYAWNVGNFKSVPDDGRSFCYRVCWENMTVAAANAAQARADWRTDNPSKRNVVIESTSGSTAKVWFYPDHPAARFRAYRTLTEGLVDYLASLKKRFTKAWPAVLSGDPKAFAKLLKDQGYYTDTVENYTRAMTNHFATVSRVVFDRVRLPTFTEDEKREVLATVALVGMAAVADQVLRPGEVQVDVEEEQPPTDPEPGVA